jgi:hypothetical protein
MTLDTGVGGHWHGWIEPGDNATFCGERLPCQAEDVSGAGVRDVQGTVQGHCEVPAVDDEFERQDAERMVCGQRSPAEHDVVSQAAAAPPCQDRSRQLLDALVDAADRLGDVVHQDQCLFGTGEFVHGPSCQGAYGG